LQQNNKVNQQNSKLPRWIWGYGAVGLSPNFSCMQICF